MFGQFGGQPVGIGIESGRASCPGNARPRQEAVPRPLEHAWHGSGDRARAGGRRFDIPFVATDAGDALARHGHEPTPHELQRLAVSCAALQIVLRNKP